MNDRLPSGKIPWELLQEFVTTDLPPEVKLGPACGEDAALIEIGDEIWAVASDPVTFTSAEAGRLSVIINANDVAVRGARPKYFLAVCLISPDDASPSRIGALMAQIEATCSEVGASLIGGHSEVTPGLSESLVIGTMLAKVDDRAITTGGLHAGDRIGMTRWAGLEGTLILLSDYGEKLASELGSSVELGEELAASDWLLIANHALKLATCRGVHALHDVTEGGVGEALFELATASGLDIVVDRDVIPILDQTRLVCATLGIDPIGLLGSGSLVFGCAKAGCDAVERALTDEGVPFTWIGYAEEPTSRPSSTLPRFSRDELLKTTLIRTVRGVIFDMDGTLVDSEYDWSEIRRRLGVSGTSIIDDLNSLEEPLRSKKWAELEGIEARASRRAKLHQGAVELLETLHDCGVATALVTNNSKSNTNQLLVRLGLEFDVVLTRDSGLWKPSGAPLREAAQRLGIDPGECLAVGDSRYDVLAAREAGCGGVCLVHDGSARLGPVADLSFSDLRAFRRYLRIVLG